MYQLTELSDIQSKESINIKQTYDVYREAMVHTRKYAGSMTWKTVGEKHYLYAKSPKSQDWKCIGRRSAETEQQYERFKSGKEQAKERLEALKAKLNLQAKFSKAVGINRVPTVIANIAREIEKSGAGDGVCMIGTNAIHAYESMANVFVDNALMATEDVDFLWDSRASLSFAAGEESEYETGFLAILQKADKTFKRSERQLFRAANNHGYLVDLIIAEPKKPLDIVPDQVGGSLDLKATGIGTLRWLINAPKIKATVVDMRGMPCVITVPDPRCFAVHKMWLSKQEGRNPQKKGKDRAQALIVAELVREYLPMLKFEPEQLRMFPKALLDSFSDELGHT